MGRYSSYINMGANIKHFIDEYCMGEINVNTTWKCMCEKNEDVITVCMQVKELVVLRDIYADGVLNRGIVVKLLNVYVQSNVFYNRTC